MEGLKKTLIPYHVNADTISPYLLSSTEKERKRERESERGRERVPSSSQEECRIRCTMTELQSLVYSSLVASHSCLSSLIGPPDIQTVRSLKDIRCVLLHARLLSPLLLPHTYTSNIDLSPSPLSLFLSCSLEQWVRLRRGVASSLPFDCCCRSTDAREGRSLFCVGLRRVCGW